MRSKRAPRQPAKSRSRKKAAELPLRTDPPGNSVYAELAGEGPGTAADHVSSDFWMPIQPSDGSDDAPTVIRTNQDLDGKE